MQLEIYWDRLVQNISPKQNFVYLVPIYFLSLMPFSAFILRLNAFQVFAQKKEIRAISIFLVLYTCLSIVTS